VTLATRRVLLIIHNPTLHEQDHKKLHDVLGWNDPDELTQLFIRDLKECSHGMADMKIEERVEVNTFPVKEDGFVYTEKSYLKAWRSKSGFHMPDAIDYQQLLSEFDILHKIQRELIDEVWLFGFPYAGCYESIMAGPSAFWCNAPPLPRTDRSNHRFVIMAFNYERGVGEMLESFGHRAESILNKTFEGVEDEFNLWKRFTRHHLTHPDRAEVGTIHFAPNSLRDYDWGNSRTVISYCDNWLHPPGFQGEPRRVNCQEWGNGDTRLHHLWWFRHIPHFPSSSAGVLNNWWQYILDPDSLR
jgi:hypothetical protein